MGNQQTLKPSAPTKIPSNYPSIPTPGKLQILWNSNNHDLYHKLSPYVEYSNSLIGGFTTQPYNYTYPDEGNKGLAGLRKYESRMFPIGSAPLDVIRVSKFLASGNGIIFLGKQFLLQTGNSYNETRIYNPTSTIIAAGMGLALGAIRPQRNFDTSAGLAGIASSLIGSAIPNALFGAPKINKPDGTAPDALIGGPLETTGGKGVLRAGTANAGRAHLETAWPKIASGGGSGMGGFGSIVKGLAKSLFANFIPATQDGIKQKSDEGTYGLMIGAGSVKFNYMGNSDARGFHQRWIAGSNIMRKDSQDNKDGAGMLYPKPDGTYILFTNRSFRNYVNGNSIGYSIAQSLFRSGIRYGESFGANVDPGHYASDIMKMWVYYSDTDNKYSTKKTKTDDIDSLNNNLQNVLKQIKKSSGGLYNIIVPDNSSIIGSGKDTLSGYDKLDKTVSGNAGENPINYQYGMLHDYKDAQGITMVDDTIKNQKQRSYQLPTNGKKDGINTLMVLDKNMKVPESKIRSWQSYNDWNNNIWEPYADDLIAFFFYDVVNEKYIPFRASIKGIVESGNASWEELAFMGRSDKVYSYGGFNRNLSFNFDVVISSISELAPTWQRINYLTTLIKPANYTTDTQNLITNRFSVPPMVMLTVGDMYRDQPVLIQTITTTIPEDASWELQNENNPSAWQYLSTYITTDSSVLYAQMPRTIGMSVSLILLEKERAMVGGANFGHAPRRDNNLQVWNTETVPNGRTPTKFQASLVVSKDNAKIYGSVPDKVNAEQRSG